jgi:hypothetical protein
MNTWLPGGVLFGSIEARADNGSSEATSFVIASAEAVVEVAELGALLSFDRGAETVSGFDTRAGFSVVEVLPQPHNEIEIATAQH